MSTELTQEEIGRYAETHERLWGRGGLTNLMDRAFAVVVLKYAGKEALAHIYRRMTEGPRPEIWNEILEEISGLAPRKPEQWIDWIRSLYRFKHPTRYNSRSGDDQMWGWMKQCPNPALGMIKHMLPASVFECLRKMEGLSEKDPSGSLCWLICYSSEEEAREKARQAYIKAGLEKDL